MKKIIKIIFIVLTPFLILTACSKKTSQKVPATKQTKTQQTTDSTTLNQAKTATPTTQTTPTTSPKEQTKAVVPSRDLPKSLLPYSDAQIEYARVWLAVLGSDYVNYLDNPDFKFELNVSLIPAGSLVNPHAEGTPTYPVDVINLSGIARYQGSVLYASNHDGTVTVYPTPMHWHYSEEQSNDPKFLEESSQWVLDNTEIVPIPAGDPDSVKRLIDVMTLNL